MRRVFLFVAMVFAIAPVFAQNESDFDEDTLGGVISYIVPDYNYLGRVTTDKNSPFYYPRLVKRFAEADTSLTLEEVHCLYYGWVLQKDYDPYIALKEEDEALKILKQEDVSVKDARRALKLLDAAVEKAPTHLRLYMYRHYANTLVYGEDSKQVQDDAFRYIALISAIIASGHGDDFESAFHVAVVAHSYAVMNYFGFEPISQSLQYHEGMSYDVFELQENEYEVEKLYFNVNQCLEYLSRSFSILEEPSLVQQEPVTELDIPIGHKVVLKLGKKKRGVYRFTVVEDIPFNDTIDMTADTENLFPDTGDKNTIILYCAPAHWPSGKSCVVLLMKSFYSEMLQYDTYIRNADSLKFVTTSNNGIYPQVRGMEIWNDPVSAVRVARIRPWKK